jgi:arabinogalactan oligomer / maltooligosaccharide transport system permease protein
MARTVRAGRAKEAAAGWAWVAPAALATGILILVPFAVGLTLSLFDHREGTWTFVGLANFGDIIATKSFGPMEPLSFYYALFVTVLWTVVNLSLHVGLGLALALLLNRPLLKLKGVYRVLLIVPWAVPNYITALLWKGLFHKQFGAINGLLDALGIEGVAWFSSFWTAFFANVCTNAWLGFPFMMVVCLGALQSIPRDLYEAADVDGAGVWQKFRHVTLPLLLPALVPAVLLGTVWTFNQFNIVYLVSGGEPDNSTDILISEAYRWAFARQDQYGYAAAYAALIFALLLGWSAISSRIARSAEALRA